MMLGSDMVPSAMQIALLGGLIAMAGGLVGAAIVWVF